MSRSKEEKEPIVWEITIGEETKRYTNTTVIEVFNMTTREALEDLLKSCEESESYEHCAFINEYIKQNFE